MNHRTHGIAATYRGFGCRCKPCTAAHAVLARSERHACAARLAADPSIPVTHGTVYTYRQYGCRCDPCTEANTNYDRDRRARKAAAA